jgi:hypothetical protein
VTGRSGCASGRSFSRKCRTLSSCEKKEAGTSNGNPAEIVVRGLDVTWSGREREFVVALES